MIKLLLLILSTSLSRSFLIDFPLTKMITISDTSSYFGYSILLQKGEPPIAIVGAPRQKHFNHTTGGVFQCNLNSAQCEEFNTFSNVRRPFNRNGDFLGSNLVGEPNTAGKFYSCAPRHILEVNNNYYLNGQCYYFANSLNTKNRRVFEPLISQEQTSWDRVIHLPYYNAAFGEAGFDMSYIKENNALLLGAPGKALSTGAIVSTNTLKFTIRIISPPYYHFSGQDYYHGYAVAWGNFIKGSDTKWAVSGGPRANQLKGNVVFYNQDGSARDERLSGEELGSYFGASLLVIHKTGGGDDILVGAPMYSGRSYDEGCVYYYRNKNNGIVDRPVKLSNKKVASRFGTVMSSIGDIDLDTFADCAIAAPYENDGVGAVYIFLGTRDGFSDDRFYRISPSSFSLNFPRTLIKGFGLGLSNGNDVDNNGHNDVVIGAYQTNQIFYFRTKQLFDIEVNATADKTILYTSTKNFSVTLCIAFSYRNKENKNLIVETKLTLTNDRILNRVNAISKMTLQPNVATCRSETILLKEDHLNIEPIVITYGYRTNRAYNFTESSRLLPVSFQCGEDNICETNLVVKTTKIEPQEIVFGVHNQVKVNIGISNVGESAYQTKLHLMVPPEVSLINLRECDLQNGSYICLVSPVLTGKIEKSFLFDVANLKPDKTVFAIRFKVESIGKDVDASDNQLSVNIPVVLQSNSHIDSRSQPENFILNKSEDLKISHSFLVSNDGPSPLDLRLRIFIPKTEINRRSLLKIESMEGTLNGVTSNCKFEKTTSLVANLHHVRAENDTKLVSCGNSLETCSVIRCSRGFLPKSNQYAIFTLKMIVRVDEAVNLLQGSSKLLLVSTAYYHNGTKEFSASASTLIVSVSSPIPLWIYLVAVIAGLILLMVLILTLYKCNFFKRTYRELLENQQQDENAEQCERIIQDEDL